MPFVSEKSLDCYDSFLKGSFETRRCEGRCRHAATAGSASIPDLCLQTIQHPLDAFDERPESDLGQKRGPKRVGRSLSPVTKKQPQGKSLSISRTSYPTAEHHCGSKWAAVLSGDGASALSMTIASPFVSWPGFPTHSLCWTNPEFDFAQDPCCFP